MDLAKDTYFPRVQYDTATGKATYAAGEGIKPATCVCNETNSDFAKDPKYGRHEALKRTRWTFDLIMAFAAEVSLEKWEQDVLLPVPRQAKDAARGIRGFAVRLVKGFVQ